MESEFFQKVFLQDLQVRLQRREHKFQLRQEVLSLQEQLKEIAEKKLYINNKHDEISSHTKVISQMNTLIKRDFRGYLLQDIINFIEGRARIYAAELFGSSDLVFTLNGNNIEIAYCNKTFENLSGGEQQKVDLIICLLFSIL